MTERSEERARRKLASVLERTITLDALPVAAIYNNIVLDLVQHLDRRAATAGQPSPVMPDDVAEWGDEVPLATDDVAVDLLSLVGTRFSG